ncbi:MAG TPA: Spy/CpxP family protein refolding chaperone [Caulobacteraceae bacterium]|nr:Spy/CpxP family protein refolding chaperone [Caulobacteraceae bacterium]
MSITTLRLALVAGLALPLCLASASLAQDAPPAPPGPTAAHAEHHRDPAERRAHMAQHLRDVLQLQPGQEAALAAYLDALKPPADMGGHMDRDRDADEHLTTPQRLDKMLAHMDAMRAHMASVADATKRFYAQLSPSQQKAFDDLAPMMMMHHMGGGHHDGMQGFHHHDDGEGHPMGPGGPPPG